ncbi:hypothetical protein [Acetobacter syzygii]|uniref:Uncharacterized protein n=1 Tax=Acetobacter syzygii TaxID=146476 RepID=A0A270B7J3_9PROT|nr:hypothetical protein [Acetobacter syzygii]PAL21015.1 hypothetical protein B9K05_11690 [Acetobacter syzygii]PAL23346.1 hypothetical protein B9K04_11655 [Acetobacter syzygii]
MITPTNWPNPERPGVPLFYERDGVHIFQDEGEYGTLGIFWSANNRTWYCDEKTEVDNEWPSEILQNCRYIGPVLTPTQISEMLAGERERVEAEMGAYVKNIMDAHPEWNMEQLYSALKEREAIRNLGAAP